MLDESGEDQQELSFPEQSLPVNARLPSAHQLRDEIGVAGMLFAQLEDGRSIIVGVKFIMARIQVFALGGLRVESSFCLQSPV
jgi:hypothetical protein